MKNFSQTILSQFQSSPVLMAVLRAVNQWFSSDAAIESFYYNCMDILTAEGEGLDVLGRIVVIPRILSIPSFSAFGFGEAGDRVGFDQGPFCDYITVSVTNFTLTNDAYRSLILAKAAFNISDGSIPSINSILMNILFLGRGNAYVTEGGPVPPPEFGFGEAGDRTNFSGGGPFGDLISLPGQNMSLTYVFEFPLQPFEAAMVRSGVLPKPTGVLPNWSYTLAS